MTLSILLTSAWDSKTANSPPNLDIPKVRPHRFSWKGAGTVGMPRDPWHVKAQRWIDSDEGGATDEAEVITSPSDEWLFQDLHGVRAKDADYDELARCVAQDECKGIVDVIREMATQHPDAMWFVRSWSVETSAPD